MDNKKLFEAALSAKMSDYPFSDTKTVMNNIMERAEKMKNHENAKQMKFTEITPEYIEPKKSHKAISVVAGIAGTAAVLTGAVFGLNWLSEHGGLKVGGIGSNNGAGYHDTSETAGALQTDVPCTMPAKAGEEFIAPTSNTVEPETLPDISELYGKAVQFHDATVWLNSAEYDGETFTARFSILYTGDDYENYSPEYVKLTVGTPIDYNTEQFSIEEVPEADGFSHRCTYSVPVKLEPLKAYAMGIEYLNTDGKTTQPIEADRQRYKFVYSGDGVVYEFERCSVMPVSYTFDGMTLDMNCYVRFKDSSVKDEPDLGLFFTSPYSASVFDSDREIIGDGAYLHIRVMCMALADKCSITIGDNVVDNTFVVQSEMKEYTLTAERADDVKFLQSEIDPPEGHDDEIYPGFVSVAPSAVFVAYYGTSSDTFVQPEKLVIEFDDGRTIEGEYLSQVFTYKARISGMRYNIPVCDPQLIRKIYLGDRCIYESPAEDTDSSVIDLRTGYWEGDDAIDILKQYAGDDYCFPFEKLEKEKVSYYDGDKWTNSDEIMFNFAVGEEGVPIKAITGGTVVETFSKNVPGYAEGIYITIQATDGRKWRYRHLSDFYVTEGDTVRAGDVIAAVGATGWCTGPCLTISFPEDEAEPTALEGGIVGTATNID